MSAVRRGGADRIRARFDDCARRRLAVLWRVRADDGRLERTLGEPLQPFFRAGGSKLVGAAVVAQLRDDALLDWDRPIAGYLPELDLRGLVTDRRGDHPDRLTARALLGHTSGLADHFLDRRPDGPSTAQRLVIADRAWSLDDALRWCREIQVPNRRRPHHSNTGYQLLAAAVEAVTGTDYATAVRTRLAEPLGLTGTYVFTESDLSRFGGIAPVRRDGRVAMNPIAAASMGPYESTVTTLDDAAVFVEAFFGGRLFDRRILEDMQRNERRVPGCGRYGAGVRVLRAGGTTLYGAIGVTGSVLVRSPELGLTVVGTCNEVSEDHRRHGPRDLLAASVRAARASRAAR